ncbi:MAG TPA: CaiB/BaiF CoA-transferase family protein [Steroidobacteraceae bacterium]|nr:CaiB/BaiF CoA-transferase family protein [Steroidobacteraceae bacterium]
MASSTVRSLSHLKVIDLSRVLAGPWAGQLLADLGAEVIKIERPGSGDDTRGWGPPYLATPEGEPTRESAYYLAANRNKKSLSVDLATPEGAEIVRRLAARADVIIENFKVGGLQPYGLDYQSLRAINPRLVYCSITGFGQSGPYASRPGYDLLIQAMGGLMSITGASSGPGSGPQKVGVAVADILTGLYSSVGILAALAYRDRTGVGQHIDVALLDVEVACLANQAMNFLVSGKSPSRMGNAHPNIVPYQDFATADGAMIIAVGNDAQFKRLCEAIGLPALAGDPRYLTNAGRLAHRDELVPAIAAAIATRPTRDWVVVIEAAGVPCGPINTIEQVFDDPQVVARGMRRTLDHPLAGSAPSVANPLRLSQTPVEYRSGPPLLGQNNAEVLEGWLGLSADEISRLVEKGIL